MSGWLILPLLCLAGLTVNPALRHLGRSSRVAMTLSLVSLAALAVVLVLAASPRLGGRFTGRRGIARFMGAVHEGIGRIRRRPIAVAEVVGAALVYQLAVITAALLAARALGIHIGPTALLAFVPAVAIVQVLPVSFGGLGVREGAFVLFLKPLGVSNEHAIALGLVLYAMQLISSLLGAPSLAVGQRPGPPTAPVVPAARGPKRPGRPTPRARGQLRRPSAGGGRSSTSGRSTACTRSSATRRARRAAGRRAAPRSWRTTTPAASSASSATCGCTTSSRSNRSSSTISAA